MADLTHATASELRCHLCKNEKPLVKWLDDDGVWRWLGVDCAAAKGNPLAVQLKTTAWINSRLESVISVEGVQ